MPMAKQRLKALNARPERLGARCGAALAAVVASAWGVAIAQTTTTQTMAPAIIQSVTPSSPVAPQPGLSPQPALVAGPTGQTAAAPAFDLERTLEAAREAVHRYKERLKGQLQSALKSDGPANAISLCQTISPDLVTELADTFSFEVGRTALKLRNPENAPGPWELEVLRQFQEKTAGGAEPEKLEQHTIVTTAEGDRVFRYMRGIKTGEMCLACHGSELKPDVKAELVRYYPDDKATGYRVGDLRGAFVVQKLIGE